MILTIQTIAKETGCSLRTAQRFAGTLGFKKHGKSFLVIVPSREYSRLLAMIKARRKYHHVLRS